MEEISGIYDYDYFNTSSSSLDTNDDIEESIQKLPGFRSGKLHSEQILTCHRMYEVLEVLRRNMTKVIYFNNSDGINTFEGRLKTFISIKIEIQLAEIGPATLLTIKKLKGETLVFQDAFLALSQVLSLPMKLTSLVCL